MADFAERLRLDQDEVIAVAASHVGYAVALQREAAGREAAGRDVREVGAGDEIEEAGELEDMRSVAASALMIGASLYSLVFPRLGRVLFRAAAEAYDDLELPYGIVLALCGNHEPSIERHWTSAMTTLEELESEGDAAASLLLLAARRAATGAPDVAPRFESWSRLISAPPGAVGIPARIYHDLADELLRGSRMPGARLALNSGRLLRVFEAFEERVEVAQANEEQWRILHTALLPVEPEVLAAAVAVVIAVARWGMTVRTVTERRSLSPVAHVPLDIAMEMEQPITNEERSAVRDSDALRVLWQRFSTTGERP